MSSFSLVLLEDGVEMELPTDLTGLISLLDREVPNFSCQGLGYTLTAGKAVLGSRWDLMVKSVNLSKRDLPSELLGRVELEKLDDTLVQFRIPPRAEQCTPEIQQRDPEGRIFGSFVFQTLNVFQRHRLVDLPGVLPTS